MIDWNLLVYSEEMKGEDSEDTALLRGMEVSATSFLQNFSWCKGVRQSFFGCGIGGICAIFLYQIVPSSDDVDEWLWVITGDIPPAYLVIDQADKPSAALALYIEEMRAWVKAAESGQSIENLIPVNALPSEENAKRLRSRLGCLEDLNLCGD